MTAPRSRSARPKVATARVKRSADDADQRAFTSRQAARASGVPFFTVDYWARSRFLVPSVARGSGRGRGRERMYSFGDVLRLAIARELRNQRVSLETLRSIVRKLAPHAEALADARYVLVGGAVEIARSDGELVSLLRRRGRATFGVLLELRPLLARVSARAATIGT